jgi:ribosomal protein S18 acetylase RimI-like enzyme
LADLERIDPAVLLEKHVDEVREVWLDATDERIGQILPRHAERDGFRFVAARAPGGRLAGFAYGYRGGPGEWWHDLVAEALGEELSARWLPNGHFEFVELHVRTDLRRSGIGTRLHDALLDGLESPTAVLSTERTNEPAIDPYLGRGWRVILEEIQFGAGYPPYLVMGRDLG